VKLIGSNADMQKEVEAKTRSDNRTLKNTLPQGLSTRSTTSRGLKIINLCEEHQLDSREVVGV
jgi:hypothetical protein